MTVPTLVDACKTITDSWDIAEYVSGSAGHGAVRALTGPPRFLASTPCPPSIFPPLPSTALLLPPARLYSPPSPPWCLLLVRQTSCLEVLVEGAWSSCGSPRSDDGTLEHCARSSLTHQLEDKYAKPAGKSLFGGSDAGKALAKFIEGWANTTLAADLRPLIGPKVSPVGARRNVMARYAVDVLARRGWSSPVQSDSYPRPDPCRLVPTGLIPLWPDPFLLLPHCCLKPSS